MTLTAIKETLQHVRWFYDADGSECLDISKIDEALAMIEGMVLVPKKATYKMCNATDPGLVEGTEEAAMVWDQMIAAVEKNER